MKFETLWIDSRETAKQEEEWLPKLEMHGHRAFLKEMPCFRSLFSPVSLSSEHLPARSFLFHRAGSAPALPDPMNSPDDTRNLVRMSEQTLTGQESAVGKKHGKGTPISELAPNPGSRRGASSSVLLPVTASGRHRKSTQVPEKSWYVPHRASAGTQYSVLANFSELALQPGVAVKILVFFPFLTQCWLLLLD